MKIDKIYLLNVPFDSNYINVPVVRDKIVEVGNDFKHNIFYHYITTYNVETIDLPSDKSFNITQSTSTFCIDTKNNFNYVFFCDTFGKSLKEWDFYGFFVLMKHENNSLGNITFDLQIDEWLENVDSIFLDNNRYELERLDIKPVFKRSDGQFQIYTDLQQISTDIVPETIYYLDSYDSEVDVLWAKIITDGEMKISETSDTISLDVGEYNYGKNFIQSAILFSPVRVYKRNTFQEVENYLVYSNNNNNPQLVSKFSETSYANSVNVIGIEFTFNVPFDYYVTQTTVEGVTQYIVNTLTFAGGITDSVNKGYLPAIYRSMTPNFQRNIVQTDSSIIDGLLVTQQRELTNDELYEQFTKIFSKFPFFKKRCFDIGGKHIDLDSYGYIGGLQARLRPAVAGVYIDYLLYSPVSFTKYQYETNSFIESSNNLVLNKDRYDLEIRNRSSQLTAYYNNKKYTSKMNMGKHIGSGVGSAVSAIGNIASKNYYGALNNVVGVYSSYMNFLMADYQYDFVDTEIQSLFNDLSSQQDYFTDVSSNATLAMERGDRIITGYHMINTNSQTFKKMVMRHQQYGSNFNLTFNFSLFFDKTLPYSNRFFNSFKFKNYLHISGNSHDREIMTTILNKGTRIWYLDTLKNITGSGKLNMSLNNLPNLIFEMG